MGRHITRQFAGVLQGADTGKAGVDYAHFNATAIVAGRVPNGGAVFSASLADYGIAVPGDLCLPDGRFGTGLSALAGKHSVPGNTGRWPERIPYNAARQQRYKNQGQRD